MLAGVDPGDSEELCSPVPIYPISHNHVGNTNFNFWKNIACAKICASGSLETSRICGPVPLPPPLSLFLSWIRYHWTGCSWFQTLPVVAVCYHFKLVSPRYIPVSSPSNPTRSHTRVDWRMLTSGGHFTSRRYCIIKENLNGSPIHHQGYRWWALCPWLTS